MAFSAVHHRCQPTNLRLSGVYFPMLKFPSSKIFRLHLLFFILFLAALTFAYFRFWNIASVNGYPISRLHYFKNLGKRDGSVTLNQMIETALIFSEAQKKGIKVSPDHVDADIASITAQLKAQDQTLESVLAAQCMTKDDLLTQIQLQKIVDQLVNPAINISPQQIDEYLTANKAFLPKNLTKTELRSLALKQLTAQARNQAVSDWLAALKKSANIVYY